MRLIPIMLLALATLTACGGVDGPTMIDGSSQAAFDQTLKDARSDLGPKDRLKFEAALTEFRGQMFAKADNRQEYNRLVREGMDGLTAQGIVTQFNKDVDRVGGQAADAAFNAKRALKGL